MKKIYLILNCLFLFAGTLLSQAPYASYPLDGNANDVSGNSLNGTIYGSPTPTTNRFNQPNKALLFNGSTDYIVLPSPFDFPNRTVIVWFYATHFGSAVNVNVVYVSDNVNLQYGKCGVAVILDSLSNYGLPSSGEILGLFSDQLINFATTDSNQWYQVAIVRTPQVVKGYLNGSLVSSRSTPNDFVSGSGIAQTAVVGADRSYANNFYGKIDDLEIYNVAVSDSVIQANYNAGGYNIFNDTTYVTLSTTDTLIINATLTGVSGPNNINTLKVFPNPAKTISTLTPVIMLL